jgi:intein-encoded DNA endonuclease-like protein
MMISKRWCKSNNSPYNNKRLMEVMPSHFKNDYTVLPKHIEQIFREEKI